MKRSWRQIPPEHGLLLAAYWSEACGDWRKKMRSDRRESIRPDVNMAAELLQARKPIKHLAVELISALLCVSLRSSLFDPKVPGALYLPLDVLHTSKTLAFRQEGDFAAKLHCLDLIASIELSVDRAVNRLLN